MSKPAESSAIGLDFSAVEKGTQAAGLFPALRCIIRGMPRARPLALSGLMGVGKSTVGRILAARAGVPMIDVDAQMEAEAGRSVAAIFGHDGELGFRALESATLGRLLRDGTPRVLALGGGAVTHAP